VRENEISMEHFPFRDSAGFANARFRHIRSRFSTQDLRSFAPHGPFDCAQGRLARRPSHMSLSLLSIYTG
jgi:hypothetical protein